MKDPIVDLSSTVIRVQKSKDQKTGASEVAQAKSVG